jgi:arsenate reductase (thioredoxin)
MSPTLGRRLVAEGVGTAFLIIAVVGSGIMATNLSGDNGLRLLENAAATAGALIGLILMFGAVSGAHFNPVVTLVDRLFGKISTRDAALYAVVQTVGGCVGAVTANVMFSLPAFELSRTPRSSGAIWLSEVIATIGLLLVIHGCVRNGREAAVPYAVGVWIGGAYWFTSSTSFANPAVTVARMLSDSFAGIKPSSAPMFIAMQLVGGLLAFALIDYLYASPEPHSRPEVLFVCVHNAGRSQMAAALLARHSGDRVVVRSAGTAPADSINPAVVEAMSEIGIDLVASEAYPKGLDEAAVRASDVVITMGCGDECPFFPGKRYIDWQLDDPAGQGVEAVRPIRDEIERRVMRLVDELVR